MLNMKKGTDNLSYNYLSPKRAARFFLIKMFLPNQVQGATPLP
jgi:hypothetical protein